MKKRLLLLGSGGHCKVLISILHSQNEKIEGYFNIENNGAFFDIPYLGEDSKISDYSIDEFEIINGIGDVQVRNYLFTLLKEKGYSFKRVIHDKAVVAKEVELGEGVQILANAIIQPNAKLEGNVIINTGAIIEHDCFIGQSVHVSPGSIILGGGRVKKNSHIGSNSTVLPNIVIGEKVVVGAGSVVTKNITDNKICWGNPALERRTYE